MKNVFTTKLIAACAIYTLATGAFAHDGHGLKGAHWHATDVWGFVALVAVITMAIWLGRGDK